MWSAWAASVLAWMVSSAWSARLFHEEVSNGKEVVVDPSDKPDTPSTMTSIHPYFTILNRQLAETMMEEFVEKTRSEPGAIYYGWTVDGDTLFCREAYIDGDAVLAHLDNVGDLLGKFLDEGAAKLDRIEFHGPAFELDKLKETASGLNAALFEVDQGFSFLVEENTHVEREHSFVSIHPYFSVNPTKQEALYKRQFVRQTQAEVEKCLYYAWVETEDRRLFCREAYVDAEGVLTHLGNVGGILGDFISTGAIANLTSLEIHGPAEELAIIKTTAGLPDTTRYFATSFGFQRFRKGGKGGKEGQFLDVLH